MWTYSAVKAFSVIRLDRTEHILGIKFLLICMRAIKSLQEFLACLCTLSKI